MYVLNIYSDDDSQSQVGSVTDSCTERKLSNDLGQLTVVVY